MAHIDSIGASVHTRIDYVTGTISDAERTTGASAFASKFEASAPTATAAGTSVTTIEEVEGIREFPSLGTPSNVVNVPVFGRSTSDQVQGQADAPSLEFTFNYIPTKHAKLDTLRKNDTSVVFRVRISASENGGKQDTPAYNPTGGAAEYADLYFEGKVASFEIVPALTDATQANIALTIQGEFEGPFSYDTAGTYGLPS